MAFSPLGIYCGPRRGERHLCPPEGAKAALWAYIADPTKWDRRLKIRRRGNDAKPKRFSNPPNEALYITSLSCKARLPFGDAIYAAKRA